MLVISREKEESHHTVGKLHNCLTKTSLQRFLDVLLYLEEALGTKYKIVIEPYCCSSSEWSRSAYAAAFWDHRVDCCPESVLEAARNPLPRKRWSVRCTRDRGRDNCDLRLQPAHLGLFPLFDQYTRPKLLITDKYKFIERKVEYLKKMYLCFKSANFENWGYQNKFLSLLQFYSYIYKIICASVSLQI